MKNLATFLLLIIAFSTNAQETGRKDSMTRKLLLFTECSFSKHERFKGEILMINEYAFKYDDKLLFVINTSNELKRVFELGILYPNLFFENIGKKDVLNSSEINNDSVVVIKLSKKDSTRIFCNRSDSLTISNFKERKDFSKSPTIKRFDFLLFFKGFANPTEFWIDLTNESADKETDLKTFIDGANITFIKKGSLQI